ncbi:TLD domain-containing protein 1-like isoform X1 [Papaver somniferum]|uniref:TLD domain-containing protein 1-like isoform X1 n=2 Tax=Papaver somniferum TaxID=3469 RepID=UPI000E6FA169|nr:TLD domain-containing protein 1-like isoform X1 [Papaver somniferum]
MGNTQSPESDPRFVSARRAFTQHYLDDLRSLFQSLAAQSQSNSKYISPSIFQEYYGIKGPLGQTMFDLVTQKRNDQKLTFEDLVIAKSVYEKGTRNEIDEFIYQLLDVNGDDIVDRSDLEAVITAMLDAVFSSSDAGPVSSSPQGISDIFLNAATFSDKVEGHDKSNMSFKDFKSWCSLLPSVRKFLGSLLMPPNPGKPGFEVPRLLYPEDTSADFLILRREYAWHIAGALSQHEAEEWKLLYHSSLHGLSFNTFMGNVTMAEGPTLLIVKDKEGCVYGGYASQPWERHSDFYGDMKSFLFQLFPQASIYRPTGANTNLQWCAINFSSESIPNGLGFGGKVHHFGLFLSASFDQGQTFSCTTFGSPCLSKESRIYPEVIECWGVLPNGGQKDKQDALKGTVLDRFKEDRNMLNLVGIANSSQ